MVETDDGEKMMTVGVMWDDVNNDGCNTYRDLQRPLCLLITTGNDDIERITKMVVKR